MSAQSASVGLLRTLAERWPVRTVLELLRLGGVDRAIGYAVFGRALTVVTAPVSMILIARFLTKPEQGYYYTFGSLLGLAQLFDLGVSYVILVNASHERAHLEWSGAGTLEGDPAAKARLASLLRVSLLWYGVVASIVLIGIAPFGVYFFGHKEAPTVISVLWRGPWLAVVIVTAVTIFITPLWAVLQGCGLVAEVELVRLLQQVLATIAIWLALSRRWALFTVTANMGVAVLFGLGWLFFRRRHTLFDLLSFRSVGTRFHWAEEIWPMQWRIGLSWLASWFIFQIFNPLMFRYQGPVVAGQMGMTLSVSSSLFMVGNAWINTKAPLFGQLIAQGDFNRLDIIFFRALRQSLVLVLAGGTVVVLGIVGLNALGVALAQRLLAPLPAAGLVCVAIINQVVFAEATYLRAHKREPFLWISLALGGGVGIVSWILAAHAGAGAVVLGYLLLTLVIALGGGTAVFLSKRREWHQGRGTVASVGAASVGPGA